MIFKIQKYFDKNINANSLLKKEMGISYKFLCFALIVYLLLFITSIWIVNSYPLIAYTLFALYVLDCIISRFSLGLGYYLINKIKVKEFEFWSLLIGNKKMTPSNYFRFVRKYKKNMLIKYLKKNGVKKGFYFIIETLKQKQQTDLTIYTVCIGAIFIIISTFIGTFFAHIFEAQETISFWKQIESNSVPLEFQYLYKFLVIFAQLIKITLVSSPFILAVLYYKLMLMKSNLLIELLSEIHLKQLQK